jgi:uncharacterized protein (DUF1919 family)
MSSILPNNITWNGKSIAVIDWDDDRVGRLFWKGRIECIVNQDAIAEKLQSLFDKLPDVNSCKMSKANVYRIYVSGCIYDTYADTVQQLSLFIVAPC